MSGVDQAFAKAISIIKILSRSPNGLAKPPPESRTTLYGLYKQATEGDVLGIMQRPVGDSPKDEANRRKWDAWRQQHGLSRAEAKMKYIEFLLETMRSVAVITPESEQLIAELEQVAQIAKSGGKIEGMVLKDMPHHRTGSIASNHSVYSQFLKRPTYSEFGLSERDRTERMSERAFDSMDQGSIAGLNPLIPGTPGPIAYEGDEAAIDAASWKQNVAWQLETISEEINSIRRQYDQPIGRRNNDALPTDPPSKKIDIMGQLRYLCQLVSRPLVGALRRIAIDTSVLVAFLIVVRLVRSNQAIMSRIPFTKQVFTVLGNIIAMVLKEVGFDIKTRPFGSSETRK